MKFMEFLSGMAETTGALVERAYRKAVAPPFIDTGDPVRQTVDMIHPPKLDLTITDIFEHSADARTFRLACIESSSKRLPPFRAGQYLSIKGALHGARVSRPYSISSAPHEVGHNGRGFYEITIKRLSDGFFAPFIFDTWQSGTTISATGPHGEFYHEPLRDTDDVVAIAGGSGITPFLSMARQVAHGSMDIHLTILFGVRNMKEALFDKELLRLSEQNPDRIRVCYVVSEPDGSEKCATGFIDAKLIKCEIGDVSGKTFFICGPRALHEFFRGQAEILDIPFARLRWEVSGGNRMVIMHRSFPEEAKGKIYKLDVNMDQEVRTIDARADEPILMALERAGVVADSRCRSGNCGICRSELILGNVFIEPEIDVRRRADKEYGFIHSCSTYPIGDCSIRICRAETIIG